MLFVLVRLASLFSFHVKQPRLPCVMPGHHDVLSLHVPSNIYLGGPLHRGGQRRRNAASRIYPRRTVVRFLRILRILMTRLIDRVAKWLAQSRRHCVWVSFALYS